jgi:hypothetical protein
MQHCAGRSNHVDRSMNQISRQCRQSVILVVRPTVFDCDVAAFEVTGFIETQPEGGQTEIAGLARPTG